MSPAAWLDAVRQAAELARITPRGVMTLARIAGVIAKRVNYQSGASRPTVAALTEASGVSKRQVQRWLRWLEGRGLLEVLEVGCTPQYRPGALHAGEPNLARTWRLHVQPNLDPVAAGASCKRLQLHVRRPRSVDNNVTPTGTTTTSTERDPVTRANQTPMGETPATRSRMLDAARTVQAAVPALRGVSPRLLRHLFRPYWQAERPWTTGDVLWALDHTPAGEQHWQTDTVRRPAAWARFRLGLWVDPGGHPVPGRRTQIAAASARVLAEQATRRADVAAAAAATSRDNAGHAARARELLTARIGHIARPAGL